MQWVNGRLMADDVAQSYLQQHAAPATPAAGMPSTAIPSFFKNPFATAMSGTQQGTLQPYINSMTNNAYQALYGGLLGGGNPAMQSGNAGGQAMSFQAPQLNLPSLLSNFQGFGNRSWMGK